VSSSAPNSALDFKGYLVLGDGVVEPPLARGVELELLDALDVEVGVAQGREKVAHWLFICALLRFAASGGYFIVFCHVVEIRGISARF
jgi:hypothetical protein